jgi:acyl CoA:acetate/3-ketoacid CoA transferase alpha subunit
MRNVRGALEIQVVFEQEKIPGVAAAGVGAIGGPYSPAVKGKSVEAVPEAVAKSEIPGTTLFLFTALHMDAALFKAMKGHDIGRIAT